MKNPPPKDVHTLIPGTCECVILNSKKDFGYVSKLKILKWDDYPGVSSLAQCYHKGPYKGKEGRATDTEGEVVREAEGSAET